MGYASSREVVAALRGDDADERARLIDALKSEETAPGITGLDELLYDWGAWARDEQLLPAAGTRWRFLAKRAGRGGGKTRAGSQAVVDEAAHPERCGGKMALIAPTHGDIRITMVEGESGVLACCPPWNRPTWEPGYGHGGRLRWRGVEPAAGVATAAGAEVEALCFSAEKPDRLRGPQFGFAWGDEYGAWPDGMKVHDLLNPALRLGTMPRALFTSTPRPTPFVEMLDAMAREEEREIAEGKRRPEHREYMQQIWSTWDNAENLPQSTIDALHRRYAGTAQGRQELDAELLTGDPHAMWHLPMLQKCWVSPADVPELAFVCVAVDNATEGADGPEVVESNIAARNKSGAGADTGIVTVGLGVDGLIYVLRDSTLDAGPLSWARRILVGFANTWRGRRGDEVVIERNGGGALIESNLSFAMAAEKISRHRVPTHYVRAKDGKETRAEPVKMLYEQGLVRHVHAMGTTPGAIPPLADLEFQMCRFRRGRTGYKKDRVDALVYGVTRCAEHMAQPDTGDEIRRRMLSYTSGR